MFKFLNLTNENANAPRLVRGVQGSCAVTGFMKLQYVGPFRACNLGTALHPPTGNQVFFLIHQEEMMLVSVGGRLFEAHLKSH